MNTTGILIVTVFIVLGIYDAIVVIRKGVGCSISRFLQRTALRSPVFTFCIGAVVGHIFGYMAPEPIAVELENKLMVSPGVELKNTPTVITIPAGVKYNLTFPDKK